LEILSVANFADSNRFGLKLIQENNLTWGVSPTSGKTRDIRITSSSLVAAKETVVSDELRADRMVSSVVEVAATTSGDVNYEFSAGSHDILMQAFLLGLWTRPMDFDYFKGVQVAWAATGRLDITGPDLSNYFVVGRRLKTTGFLTPANNKYVEIASIAYASGATQITMTTTTSVIEAGSAYTKVQDANDVVILNNTAIRFGTSGASAIDSNGTNAFASAIAAGNLVAGQNIYVDNGSGRETGTFSFATNAVDGDTFTVNDGVNQVTFEVSSDTGVQFGNQIVTLGGSGTTTATNITAAINLARADGRLQVKASASTTTVTVTNLNRTGGTLSDASVNAVTVNFSGGLASGGFYKILSATSDVLTVSPAPATDANSGTLGVTIKGSMLRNPDGTGVLPHQQIVAQSFTAESAFNDVNQFFVHNGLRVGSFTMDVKTGAIVTGTYSFEGKETKRQINNATKLGTAPYTPLASTGTEVMNSTTNVGSIEKDGVELSSALQSITLNGDASLRQQPAVGSKFARGIGTGRFNLTGTATAYFEGGSPLYDDFINHETTSLAFKFTDIDGNPYKYTLPAVKFSKDDVVPGGIDQDVVEPLEFMAFRDATTGTMFQIDRWSDVKNVSA
jgi:hypothetical protein